jgi:hypothetical protein
MDITRLSTDFATQRIQEQVGVAVMGKALDFVEAQSAALAKMMESAAPAEKISDPALGSRVNLLV